ncbi:MAG: lipoprotein-releasing ABC transporter permease subunit [Burkholderiales bacterium]
MRYELLVGLRYLRARRRNRFIGVNSLVSMIGVAVGVAVLIVVLSVVNGFQDEVRSRILGFASHVQIVGAGRPLADWRTVARTANTHPRVVAAAPFVDAPAMLFAGQAVRGALLRGIDPQAEERVADFTRYMRAGSLDALKAGEYGVVLGADLARTLAVAVGDKVALVAPQGQSAEGGVAPRLAQLTVVGIFEAGFQDVDASLGVVHIADAQALYRMGEAVSGVRLKLDDAFAARQVGHELLAMVPPEAYVQDWTRFNANFFRAVEITKRLMFVILVLIILVAAVNVISTLVVMVTGKQGDIAILRTMGAAPGEVMHVFVVHGMVLGLVGTLAGVALGSLIALNIDVIVPAVEHAFRVKFIAKEVYLIDTLPSALRAADVMAIAGTALALSFLATLYPSWRAARTAPADALRYE